MERKENRKKWGKLTAVLVAAVVMAAATALCMGHIKHGEPETAVSRGGMVVDARAAAKEENEGTAGNPLAGRSIYFSGIEDAAVSRKTVVRLDNRKENLDFLLRYEIYNTATGELVFETELIPSGRHIDWMPGEMLEPGEYVLDFRQIPYYIEPSGGYIGLTQASNKVALAVLDRD